jgi:hypothetical protein
MKFSVVIPLYNKAAYISTTIASVLAQSCTDFEIVVVDDGSTDGGDLLVAQLGAPQLRLIRQANAGVASARNRGIREARGQWVVFLDADDWQHPEFLAHLVRAQRACPEARTVATDYVCLADQPRLWPPHWRTPEGSPVIERITDLPARWMQGQSLCSSAVAAQRDLLEAMQPCFPTGESHGEDLDLWFRLAEKSPVALVRTPLAAYRVSVQDSLSAAQPAGQLPPFLTRLQARALSGSLSPAQRRSALWLVAQHKVTLARQAIAAGQRRQSLHWLLAARHAARGKRWWLSLAMALLLPGAMVSRWQRWRIRRSNPLNPMTDAG